jgi:GTP-binding protein
MAIPRVAIVGRPNVGKSSLLNLMARERVSIVDAMPGVTRDRVTTLIEITGPLKTEEPRLVEVTDTGGYGVYVAEGARFDDAGADLQQLTGHIEAQIAQAVERADLILFVIDAQSGVTVLDETVAKLLRERAMGGVRKGSDAPTPKLSVQVVANKVDADNWEAFALEASALGFGEPWMVSAKTNFRRREFMGRLYEALPDTPREERESAEPEMRIALVGRRNAGKSTFVNALAGEERCIVSEIAGTTRDAIDVRFEIGGRRLMAIDTAGVRKKTKFHEQVEFFALHRMQQSVRRADVVLLCIDATLDLSGIDKRLGAAIAAEHKPCLIVVTKWDLAEGRKNRKGRPISPQDYLEYLQKELPGLAFAPIVFSAAVDRVGLEEVVEVAFEMFDQARQRVGTGELNAIIRGILEERGPTSKLGKQAKILFVSQVTTNPPTIVMVVNHPELFTPGYERYLLNRLRERTPFTEIPIRLIIRERKRAKLADLLSGEHAKRKRGELGVGGDGLDDIDDEDIFVPPSRQKNKRS